MELYLLRHGIAALRGATGFADDSERPLTPEGVKKIRRIAGAMLALDLQFDVILSSPLVRAKQTAGIVAKHLRAESRLKFEPELAVGGDGRKLVTRITRDFPQAGSLLLVGHEPSMSELISLLVSGDRGLAITLKKGGLCKLVTDDLRYGQCATLEWLVTPRQLTRIT